MVGRRLSAAQLAPKADRTDQPGTEDHVDWQHGRRCGLANQAGFDASSCRYRSVGRV